MINKPLATFATGLACLGGAMLLIDMVVPHTNEGTVKVMSFTAPTGWTILAIGAVFFLLAVDKDVATNILGAIPVIGKLFQKKTNDDVSPQGPTPPQAPK